MREKNDKYQIFVNIIWNSISAALGYGISFFIIPFISDTLGIEAYGFIELANTVVSYLDIAAVAVNAFAARNIALAFHNGDREAAEEYYSSVFFSNLFFTLISGSFYLFFILKIECFLVIPDSLTGEVRILFALVFVNYSLSLLSNVFALPAFIRNRSKVTARNGSIGRIIYALLLVMLLVFFNVRVYSVTVALSVSTVIVFFLNYRTSRMFFSDIRISFRKYSFEKCRKLLSSGIWNSINNIGNMLNSGLDLLVSDYLLSSVLMGQISVSKHLANTATILSHLISNSFQPKQLEAYAQKDIDGTVKYLKLSMKCMGIMGGLITAGFIAIGRQFYATWLPAQDTELLYRLTCIVLIGEVPVYAARPLYFINTLTDKLRVVCWITIGSGFLNVAGMYILIKGFHSGGYAVVGTTMVLNFSNALFITPFLGSRFLKLSDRWVFFRIIAGHLAAVTVCAAILVPVSRLLPDAAGWKYLLSNSVLLGIIGLIVLITGELSRAERRSLLLAVKNRLAASRERK